MRVAEQLISHVVIGKCALHLAEQADCCQWSLLSVVSAVSGLCCQWSLLSVVSAVSAWGKREQTMLDVLAYRHNCLLQDFSTWPSFSISHAVV